MFDATMLLILFTVPDAGVRPGNETVPLVLGSAYVHVATAVATVGAMYAVVPLMVVTLTILGFAMIYLLHAWVAYLP
jgi:hypothetical protein